MMTITIERKYPKETYTIGRLYIDGVFLCNTLELAWKDNARNISCIPKGTYQLKLTYSPKFKRVLPLILNVPNRDGIRIHAANYPKELTGCIAPGENTIKGGVTNSRHYEEKIVSLIKGKSVTLKIL